MEEKKQVEQPSISAGVDTQLDEKLEQDFGTLENEGSTIGKFKNAQELLKAYQNLEQEFTKKSQRLKELEKTKEEYADNTDVPAYESQDWFKTVEQFYLDNPKAKGFEKEIAQLILSDKQIAQSKCPLDLAWQTLASKNYKTEEEIAGDNEFLMKYVLNNPLVQESVLKTYLEKMQKAPVLIASSKGKQINITKKNVPKTLEQAKTEVEKLFN